MTGHNERDWNRIYIVRLYGYRPEDNTLEPTENIPKHFVTRHHRRVNQTGLYPNEHCERVDINTHGLPTSINRMDQLRKPKM